MHDREFEKQVQQKMQELKFQPGSDVWARVQADIQKKRRRRPVLLWILFAGLMLGSAWILYSNMGGSKQPQAAEQVKSSETNNNTASGSQSGQENNVPDNASTKSGTQDVSKPGTDDHTSSQDEQSSNITTKRPSTPAEKRDVTRTVNPKHQQATEKPAGHKKNDRQPVETAIAQNDQPAVTGQSKKDNVPAEPTKTDKSKTDGANVAVAKPDVKKADVTKSDIAKSGIANPDQRKNDQSKTDIAKNDQSKKDNISPDPLKSDKPKTANQDVAKTDPPKSDNQDVAKNDQPKTDQPNSDQPTKKDKGKTPPPGDNASNKKSKWQWGVSTGAGVSDLATKFFKSTSVADFAYDNTFSTGGIIPNPGPSNARRYPSEINVSTSFNAGGYVSRDMGHRLRLKLGLNYEYYSYNIKTGAHIDSNKSVNRGAFMNIVEGYYQSGTTNNYTNKYHYISLPVSLQWRVNKHPKYGVVWENGISIAQLLHSNALQFDGISGSYYVDNSLLRKTQILFGSSLLFDLKMKNNRQLYVGPHVQYGLTNMIKSDEKNSKHLRYAGVKLMLGFNKN